MRERLTGEITTDVPIYLEGPYGTSHSLASYSTVILVAGGTGITYLSSNLLGLLAHDTPTIPRHVHLVWHIRYSDDVVYLADILNEAAVWAQRHPLTRVTIDIQVTKSHQADEPAPHLGLTDRLIQDYAPRRFSQQFSRNENPGAIEPVIEPRVDHDGKQEDDIAVIDEDEEDAARTSGESSVQEVLLPKKPVLVHKTGLSATAAALVTWKKGRADLAEVLENDLETTKGPMIVTGGLRVCW